MAASHLPAHLGAVAVEASADLDEFVGRLVPVGEALDEPHERIDEVLQLVVCPAPPGVTRRRPGRRSRRRHGRHRRQLHWAAEERVADLLDLAFDDILVVAQGLGVFRAVATVAVFVCV